MKIVMPADGNGTVTAAGRTISFLMAGNNEIYYYNGDSLHNIYRTDFSSAGLRSVLSSKKEIVENNFGHGAEMVVLIKPTGYPAIEILLKYWMKCR